MDLWLLIAAPITARLTAMAAPVARDDTPRRGSTSPTVDLDDFRAQVERDTDLADYPHADDVRSNVLVYSAARRGRRPTGAPCSPS